jgi:putative endonuclease
MAITSKPWYVYLVRCCDGSIYTGISDDVEARIRKHNSGKGAKYTAQRRPVSLLYSELHPDQGTAMKRESQVKRWRKDRKERLAAQTLR